MIAMPEAVGEITGRIATIQARLGTIRTGSAAGTASSGTASAANSAGTGSTFAEQLDGAVQAAAPKTTVPGTTAPRTAAPRTAAPATATGATTSGDVTDGAAAGGAITGDTVLATAAHYLGVPYVWGGTSAAGLDCSGLVQLTFKNLGIDLPRVSRDQAKAGQAVASMADARPGDLIAFGSPVDHIAIYAGDGKILEAPEPGKNVRIVEMFRDPVAIRRIVPAGDGSPLAPAVTIPDPASTTVTTALGIPPGFLKFWANVDGIPRAIPLAALGISDGPSTDDAVRAISGLTAPGLGAAESGAAGPTATGAAAGLSARQLTAAGLSDAVAAFAADFASAESRFALPSGLLAAVAQAESGGRPDAVSPAGAQGLMQLMPGTATALGVRDPFDPRQAISGAAQYLSDQLTAFGGSLDKALAAYNAGPGAVRRYGGVPPYAETQNYVKKITDMMARLT